MGSSLELSLGPSFADLQMYRTCHFQFPGCRSSFEFLGDAKSSIEGCPAVEGKWTPSLATDPPIKTTKLEATDQVGAEERTTRKQEVFLNGLLCSKPLRSASSRSFRSLAPKVSDVRRTSLPCLGCWNMITWLPQRRLAGLGWASGNPDIAACHSTRHQGSPR